MATATKQPMIFISNPSGVTEWLFLGKILEIKPNAPSMNFLYASGSQNHVNQLG